MWLLSCFLLLSLWHASDAQKSGLHCDEFRCEGKKLLLFTIKANIGKSAIGEFDNNSTAGNAAAYMYPRPEGRDGIPDLFRSSFLDNLPQAIKRTGSKVIVTEMQKNGRVVAKAVFDVTKNVEELDSHNWFRASRLVQTYPYWTGNKPYNFVDMSVKMANMNFLTEIFQRSFYIHHSHGGCEVDSGLMGIGDGIFDFCKWVTDGGKRPILFYATKEGTYGGDERVVDYADVFLVYLSR